MGKKVCITGMAGFIGYHSALKLQEKGYEVVGFDNFDPYYSVDLKRLRVANLEAKGITCFEGDIGSARFLESFYEKHKPTHTLHLAAQAGVRYSLENPDAYVHSNLIGFVNILEQARKHPQNPVIYASSSSIYGMNEKVPFSESDRTDSPVSLYGATKKCNEVIAHAYHHLFNIPLTGLRFFTVYGPYGRPDMAYFLFTKAIFEGRPIKLFNEGKMLRDFTYIDDITDGIVAAIEKSAPYAVYNLGNSECETLETFIDVLEKAIGKKAERELLPMQAGDVKQTHADLSLSSKELGFSPQTSLQEGLPKFVNWYRKHYLKEPLKT